MIELQIFGEGNDLIVLHGMPAPPTSMESLYEALADSHRVIVPNLHDLRVDSVTTLGWLEDALRSHGITSAAALGHSFGSYRAFQLAHSGGIDITRIAALSSLSHMPADVLAGYQELAVAVEADAIDITDVLLDQWFSPGFLATNPAVSGLVRQWVEELGKDGLLAAVRVAIHGPDLRPTLAHLSLPVYLRVGACDLATPEAWSREIADLLPNARLDVVEGIGHFPHFEDAPDTLAAVRDFLG